MKKASLLLAFLFCFSFIHAEYILTGIVTDSSGEVLIGASIMARNADNKPWGVVSNIDGKFDLKLPSGKYNIQVRYTGYETYNVEDFVINKDSHLNIQLEENNVELEEVAVVASGYSSHDKSSKRSKRKKAKRSSAKAFVSSPRYMSDAPPSSSSAVVREVSADRIRSKATRIASSPTPTPPKMSKEEAFMRGIGYAEETITIVDEATEQKEEAAGQLTAGEWKDLDNWTFWNGLMKDEVFNGMQKHWQFFPENRYALALQDKDGNALNDVQVILVDHDGNTVWKARTDNQGKAELWANLYKGKIAQYAILVKYEGKDYPFQLAGSYSKTGINHYSLPVGCNETEMVDISFVVDATGSMSDEINYLKAELKDVINRVKEDNEDLKIRTGSVFYRDNGEEYLTKISPFSEKLSQTTDFISQQYAKGGGDYPEAVETALDVAVNQQDWSKKALARIIFLVLDAPPHHNEDVLKQLQQTIKQAAAKGIKIIPVSASGIDKQTEFLLKFFSIATNGTYVFITDHSGIGNDHIEPTAESYNVETLNDLMTRLIIENTAYFNCKKEETPTVDNPLLKQNNTGAEQLDQHIKLYPNPAQNDVFIELLEDFDQVSLYNANGQLVRSIRQVSKGKIELDVSNLAGGIYFLRFWKEQKTTIQKLVIARS